MRSIPPTGPARLLRRCGGLEPLLDEHFPIGRDGELSRRAERHQTVAALAVEPCGGRHRARTRRFAATSRTAAHRLLAARGRSNRRARSIAVPARIGAPPVQSELRGRESCTRWCRLRIGRRRSHTSACGAADSCCATHASFRRNPARATRAPRRCRPPDNLPRGEFAIRGPRSARRRETMRSRSMAKARSHCSTPSPRIAISPRRRRRSVRRARSRRWELSRENRAQVRHAAALRGLPVDIALALKGKVLPQHFQHPDEAERDAAGIEVRLVRSPRSAARSSSRTRAAKLSSFLSANVVVFLPRTGFAPKCVPHGDFAGTGDFGVEIQVHHPSRAPRPAST